MHLYLTLPNPLARLTRILVAVEEARLGQTRAIDHQGAATFPNESSATPHTGDPGDLELLSLTRPEPTFGEGRDALDFLSLTRDEDARNGSHDGLSDASMTWSAHHGSGL
ncbi:MAG: hypothetical protein P4L84_21210 [Isosphaeraceae bacterium]|nr:hypothetical protein [Isosphaeraceae bacterium]